MTSVFQRFAPRLQSAIVSRLGWASLRPVQELAGHTLLDGDNAVVLAPTAGGKTEAALFPLLSDLLHRPPSKVGLIYLAPIKALLNNQSARFGTLTEMVGLRHFLWHGDVAASRKQSFIADPADLLMTTPESLEVMMLSARFPQQDLFADLRAVIIDEVHALAGTDRGAHLMSVLERIARGAHNDVQRVGLSATVGNPEEIVRWLRGTSRRPGRVVDPPQKPSPKDLRVMMRDTVDAIADEASRLGRGRKSLFFCQSRALTEGVAERMRGREIDVFVHHSSVSVEERQRAEARFHHGRNACIVCTSTLELGIDVGDLDLVFQANAPSTVSAFLQRLGRTGRREGHRANTTFFCEHGDAVLQAIALIELARRGWVEPVAVKTRCWPVLVHQLFALSLQHAERRQGALHPSEAWEQLSVVPDFSGIARQEFDHLIEHLVALDYLWAGSDRRLVLGEQAERVFGRRNFMELYAVFSSPQLYRVVSDTGREVGHLEQAFVDKLVEDMSAFLLSGRAWTVRRISHKDRRIIVTAAPRGRKPSWGGFLPQLLSYELCQEMADLLREEREIRYADEASRAILQELRDDLGPLLRRESLAVQIENIEQTGDTETERRLTWWTFAGGQINHALRYGMLLHQPEWNVVAENRYLRIEGAGVSQKRLESIVQHLADPSYWSDRTVQKRLLLSLPEYRLSKFQRALPTAFALEMIRDTLLDLQGAASVCAAI